MIEDLEVNLSISKEAISEIHRLMKKSQHPDPILAILWIGSGTSEDNVKWKWELTTINRGALEYVDSLRFTLCGFTFYATGGDIEILKKYINNFSIDVSDGKLVVSAPA